MGTPEFAVPSLQRLIAATADGSLPGEIIAVATQPDRPAGRGNKLAPSPVKQLALSHNLVVLQPASLSKDRQAVEHIRQLLPDVIVVAAYGLILPASVLAIPHYGCINIHGSLLPAYRGASPATAAILDGCDHTGISIMLMDAGLDTGPVLKQAAQPIYADDTSASLLLRLAIQGAELLLETLPLWSAGAITPIAQTHLPGTPSLCGRIKKEAGLIDWRRPADEIERMTRAYTPWPSAYTLWKGELFKIWQAEVINGVAPPGQVVALGKEAAVGCGQNLLRLRTVQPAGKKPLAIRNFLNGAPDFIGSQFHPYAHPQSS